LENDPFTRLKVLKMEAKVLAEFNNQKAPILLIKIKTSTEKVQWYVQGH
jgi:hypothetical protein